MIDYKIKAHVIGCGLVSDVSKVQRTFFKTGYGIPLSRFDYTLTQAEALYKSYNDTAIGSALWHEAEKVRQANYKRVKRLKRRITYMLENGSCQFLTLTFTDDVLSKTSEETRRQYVRRFLSNYSNEFVANIDFGKTNGREHYHALIMTDKRIKYTDWKGGNCDGKRVYNNNTTAIAKYISKLTNHAIKETTKQCRIIYSR